MLRYDQLVYVGLELVIACLAVAGNVLVCWAVCINSNLQSITNYFVVSLATADIAVGLLAIPFAITISTGFCSNFYGCLFIACFVLVLTQSSIFSLLAIAVDRYIAIRNPLRYSSLVTGQRAKGIIALCWVLSVGIGLTPMLGWNKGWNSTANASRSSCCPQGMTECLFEGVVTLDYMVYFNFFGCVLVPLVAMLVIYANIFMAARRQLRLMGPKVSPAPAPREMTSPPSPSRTVLQKEVHAAKSLAIIVGVFALSWLPLHIINCFNHLCPDCGRAHIWVMNISIILSHANSVVNPIIYAYRIREFRQTFRKILHQHILRQRGRRRFRVGDGDRRVDGHSSIGRGSFQPSEELSSGVTVVNSYVLDPRLDRALPKAGCEASSQWTSKPDAAASCIPNGNQVTGNAPSVARQQPCIMGFSVQDGDELLTCVKGAIDVPDVRDSESCISFVNVQALYPKQTGSTRSMGLTEDS